MIGYYKFETLLAENDLYDGIPFNSHVPRFPFTIPVFFQLKTTQQHTSNLQVLLHESYLVYIIRFRCLRLGDADVALLCVLKIYIFGIYVIDCEVSRVVYWYLLLVRRF